MQGSRYSGSLAGCILFLPPKDEVSVCLNAQDDHMLPSVEAFDHPVLVLSKAVRNGKVDILIVS